MKRPKPYRRQKWLARGVLACVVLFLGLGFLGGFRNIRGSSLADGWDTGDSRHVPKAGVVYVDLRDLEGAEQTEFWSCRTKVHELCPRLYETRQLSLGEGEGPLRPGDSYPVLSSAETTHYRLLTESLARRLTRELSRGRTSSLGVYGHPALAAAETDGLDELWWGEDPVLSVCPGPAGPAGDLPSVRGRDGPAAGGGLFHRPAGPINIPLPA